MFAAVEVLVRLPECLLLIGTAPGVQALEHELRDAGRLCLHIGYDEIRSGAEGLLPGDVVLVAGADEESAACRAVERLRRIPGADPAFLGVLLARHEQPCTVHQTLDDFVTPPSGSPEILLRLATLRLRRAAIQTAQIQPSSEVELDVDGYDALVGGRAIGLTYTEFELLRALYDRRGKVVAREKLASAVWGYERLDGSRVVDVHMWRLRNKLGGGGAGLIETVRNRGYRLR